MFSRFCLHMSLVKTIYIFNFVIIGVETRTKNESHIVPSTLSVFGQTKIELLDIILSCQYVLEQQNDHHSITDDHLRHRSSTIRHHYTKHHASRTHLLSPTNFFVHISGINHNDTQNYVTIVDNKDASIPTSWID